MQCVVSSVQCAVFNVQCAKCSVQCAVCIVLCVECSVVYIRYFQHLTELPMVQEVGLSVHTLCSTWQCPLPPPPGHCSPDLSHYCHLQNGSVQEAGVRVCGG